MISVRDMAS